MTTQDIRLRLETLIDESTGQSLKQANAIKHIGIDEENSLVILIINIGRAGGEAETKLKRQIAKIIKLDLGFKGSQNSNLRKKEKLIALLIEKLNLLLCHLAKVALVNQQLVPTSPMH